MRKSLAVALLAVFAAGPVWAPQRPGLATGTPSGSESPPTVPAPVPPEQATGSPPGADRDRQVPGMSRSGESSGDVTLLRRENAVLQRKVDLLEKQVELLRQRVRSLEGGQ